MPKGSKEQIIDEIEDVVDEFQIDFFFGSKDDYSSPVDVNIVISFRLAEKRLATYYGEIGIGYSNQDASRQQKFKMLFDTGSCHFWVPSENCTTSRCLTHNKYSRTDDLMPFDGAALEISYLSGKVEGYMGNETVVLGDIIVPNQTIGIANEVNIPLLDDVEWDGIIGLSYPNNKIRNSHVDPLFDNIIKNNILKSRDMKNVFGYVLNKDSGSIQFGKPNINHYKNQFTYSKVMDQKYWTIKLLDVQKIYRNSNKQDQTRQYIQIKPTNQNEPKLCNQGCKAIIDTGTYLIYGPQTQILNQFNDLVLDTCDQKKDLPDLRFEFEGSIVEGQQSQSIFMTITPQEYVLEFTIDGKDDCVMGISPDTDDAEWTLGQLFLKKFYTLFDRDNNQIGFAESSFTNDEHQDIQVNNVINLNKQFTDNKLNHKTATSIQQLPEPDLVKLKQQQQDIQQLVKNNEYQQLFQQNNLNQPNLDSTIVQQKFNIINLKAKDLKQTEDLIVPQPEYQSQETNQELRQEQQIDKINDFIQIMNNNDNSVLNYQQPPIQPDLYPNRMIQNGPLSENYIDLQ